MVDRYYPGAIPADVLAGLSRQCPLLLRLFSRSQTMTRASCSGLWLHPLSGVEWSRSAGDVGRYLRQRIRPSREAVQERARSEEHTSELQSLMRISYAVFCLKKQNRHTHTTYPLKHNTTACTTH